MWRQAKISGGVNIVFRVLRAPPNDHQSVMVRASVRSGPVVVRTPHHRRSAHSRIHPPNPKEQGQGSNAPLRGAGQSPAGIDVKPGGRPPVAPTDGPRHRRQTPFPKTHQESQPPQNHPKEQGQGSNAPLRGAGQSPAGIDVNPGGRPPVYPRSSTVVKTRATAGRPYGRASSSSSHLSNHPQKSQRTGSREQRSLAGRGAEPRRH